MNGWLTPTVTVCFVTGLALAGVAAAQTATVRNDDVLRAEPAATAPDAGKIEANVKVRVIERKGFWAKVSGPAATGWIKLSALNLDTNGSSSSALPSLTSLATGRVGSGNIVAAAGTRGLSADDLKTAQPDMEAVARVKAMAVPPDAAKSYAQDGGLKTRQVAYVTPSGAPKQ